MRTAVSVPLSLMRTGDDCWPHLLTLAAHGNIQTMCDLRVGSYDNVYHKTIVCCVYSGTSLYNLDTNGAEESVIVSEVSSFQRLKCMQE